MGCHETDISPELFLGANRYTRRLRKSHFKSNRHSFDPACAKLAPNERRERREAPVKLGKVGAVDTFRARAKPCARRQFAACP
jgi:hypothetical protein